MLEVRKNFIYKRVQKQRIKGAKGQCGTVSVPLCLCSSVILLLCLAVSLCSAGRPGRHPGIEGVPPSNRGQDARNTIDAWDSSRYIGLDEIRPGMEAYCLTEYGVAGIEKFGMEVVDVVRKVSPSSGPGSRDAILVKGTDERFMHTGPVAGCSGSPVYIDGRLAGALAFTWSYAKDPLYGATPIAEMLAVGRGRDSTLYQERFRATVAGQSELNFDFTEPINFADVERRLTDRLLTAGDKIRDGGYFPQVLITSGVPERVRGRLSAFAEPFGLTVVAGGSGRSAFGVNRSAARGTQHELSPGSCLAIPLVSGDISMSTYGTVTDVVGDKVYALGHYFLGTGAVDLPIAAAKVHTVVSNLASSFKLASVTEIIGALTTDEAAGVVGLLGAEAKTIPLTIGIDRYNDTEKRLYNCRLVNHKLLTPFYLRMAVAAAALVLGDLPPEHTVEYEVNVGLSRSAPVAWRNVSSGMGVNELIAESYSAVGLLMNNPYERIDVESIDVEVRIIPKSIISHIFSVDLSDAKVRAGRSVEITAVLESVLAGKKQYRWSVKIPDQMPAGSYELTICGQRDYEQFLAKTTPHRFIAQSAASLIDALDNSLQFKRDILYCLLKMPAGGIVIERAELPDLPATKTLLMADAKRTLTVRPYAKWVEKRLKTGSIVIDKKTLKITVEK